MEDNENYHLIDSEGEDESKKKNKEVNNKNENNDEITRYQLNDFDDIDNINDIRTDDNNIIDIFKKNNMELFAKIMFSFLYTHPLLNFMCKKSDMKKLFSDKTIIKMHKILITTIIICFFIAMYFIPSSVGYKKYLMILCTLIFLFLHLSHFNNGGVLNLLKEYKNMFLKYVDK